MRRQVMLIGLLSLAIAGCRSGTGASDADRTSDEKLSLEDRAREAGLVAEDETQDPVGSYALQHENGLHEMCIGSRGLRGQKFGIVADLGKGLLCQGNGRLSQEGDMLTLAFSGSSKCRIEVRYDGQSIRFPGKVPTECASLCSARATFAGMIVRRTGWTGEDARTLKVRMGRAGAKHEEALCS